MQVNYINPVLDSLVNVLGTMAAMKVRPGKPSIKTEQSARGDVTGVMSMFGPAARGSIAITFTAPVILELAQRMLRETYPGINEMVVDLAGEITNMVIGGAKAKLEEQGHKFDMSLPTLVAGANHIVMHKTQGKTVIMPFETDYVSFFVELCFE